MSSRSTIDTRRMRQFGLRLPRGLLNRLAHEQIMLGVGRATIIRRAVVEWLERHQHQASEQPTKIRSICQRRT